MKGEEKLLTCDEKGIASSSCFGYIGLEAGVDLVGRPCQEKPQEGGEEVESHVFASYLNLVGNTNEMYRSMVEGKGLLIASIKQVEQKQDGFMRNREGRPLLSVHRKGRVE